MKEIPPKGRQSLLSLPEEDLELLRKNKALDEEKKEEDDDERFIKKDDKEEQKEESEVKEGVEGAKQEIEEKGIIGKLKNMIFPKNTEVRSLGNETGGLEAEEEKAISEGDDIWDDRSEEVDKMGSTDTFNTTGMRSVVWKKKKERLDKKEMAKEALAAAAVLAKKGKGKEAQPQQSALGSFTPQQSYVDRLKNLRQDRSHEGGNNQGGGGAWR